MAKVKIGKTKFLGIVFTLKDGSEKLVKPHPKIKKQIEDKLNNNAESNKTD